MMPVKQILFNPFRKSAGMPALMAGGIVMAVAAGIAFYSNCHFDGVIDAHIGTKAPRWVYFIEALIAWGSLTFSLYVTALVFSKSKIRFTDVAGTLALARYPSLWIVLIAFGPFPELAAGNFTFTSSICLLSLLVCNIWMIALFYNAYCVSCNMKGGRAIITFIGGLVVAEVLAKILLHYFVFDHLSTL